ncbi:MAG: hypothetical protein SVY10_10820, partial [Thermodesulfobacteriota bacterium]|nr:hypothetical protein [Thermodesulfobacteriota bacterium]
MSEVWLGQKEVGCIENVTESTIWRRLNSGYYKKTRQVPSPNGGGKNGLITEIALSCLSDSAQAKYHTSLTVPPTPPPPVPVSDEAGTPVPACTQVIIPGLADWQNKIACARYDLVCEFAKIKDATKKRKTGMTGNKKAISIGKVVDEFVAGYNSGLVLGEVYNAVGYVSLKTIERWHGLLKRNNYDFSALAPKQGQ